MNRNQVKVASFLALLTFFLAFVPAWALAQDTGDEAEFAAWSRSLSGTLGSKKVSVELSLVDKELSGSYCYAPCSRTTRAQLQVSGSIDGARAELAERDSGSKQAANAVTGRWRLVFAGDTATGTWTSPDGKRSLPVRLTAAQPFPFEIRVVANALPGNRDDCDDVPTISAIRLYREGRMVQELATESQGTCGIFVPSLVDANFDGAPDLTIALTLPAGPNIPYQTWLFDPATRRFVDAPALGEITSPEFDAAHKTIVSYWRASCCEHGVTVYRWQGMKLVEVETASSVVLPVLDGRKRRYCYAIPEYRNGHIEFPDRVEQTGGRLALSFSDVSGCPTDADFPAEPMLDIWQRTPDGLLKIARSERVHWKQARTSAGMRYCREVPFFAQGRIERIVLSDDPERCSEEKP